MIILSIQNFFISILILDILGLLGWALFSTYNPKDITGIVYYKNGQVIRTHFDKFSDFEYYMYDMYENYSEEILTIKWEYDDTSKNSQEK